MRSGQDLATALTAVLNDIMSRNASAGAVATVSQQTGADDIVIRGAFDALPSTGTVTTGSVSPQYLWYGHIDAFWPFQSSTSLLYDFQLPCNTVNGSPLLCYQIPTQGCGTSNCFDFATCLWDTTQACYQTPTARTVFTGLPNKDNTSNGPAHGRVAFFNFKDGSTSNPILNITVANLTSTTLLPDGSESIGTWLMGQLSLGNPPGMTAGSVNFNFDGNYPTSSLVTEAGILVNWVRGLDYPNYPAMRKRTDTSNRTWVMGDVVYSTPVVVGTPTLAAVSLNDPDVSTYFAYRNQVIDSMSLANKPTTITLANIIKKVRVRWRK